MLVPGGCLKARGFVGSGWCRGCGCRSRVGRFGGTGSYQSLHQMSLRG